MINVEKERVLRAKRNREWKKWGPYISERQWGTVREDYSLHGSAWEYFPHDHARSRAYRWGEDGIMGICDSSQHMCFAVAMWNGKDPLLKERLFGLTGNQGNHGEDVKEYYYYLDSTPTHSYMKMLYKYPQQEYPYAKIVEENAKRGRKDPEYDLMDTGVFDDNKYFDVFTEYAKEDAEDICIKITVANRSNAKATMHLLPTLWFRNVWSWQTDPYRPEMQSLKNSNTINVEHKDLGSYNLYFEGKPDVLFCENDTNHVRIYGHKKNTGYVKDGINNFVVEGEKAAVNPALKGTKVALRYQFVLGAGEQVSVRIRLCDKSVIDPFEEFNQIMAARKLEADIYYDELQKNITNEDERNIMRQALAGMLITKQFYHYDVNMWINGDAISEPPASRVNGRNKDWKHIKNKEVISMPDKWEYPWYAAWDLAFHCIPLAIVDADYAKRQLILFLREWYMHPNGQIPAYEWHFGDVNPPVHAWACWRVFEIEKDQNKGIGDTNFLERVFHKLLLNFTWWVNRKDTQGKNIFEGGFLGLDNIGVFDRSHALPKGGRLEQADATGWMAMYSLNMLRIAIELAKYNSAYEDMASKFLEHFLLISGAISNFSGSDLNLWDPEDEFFYDVLHTEDKGVAHLKVRSMVGLIPLYAIETLEPEVLDRLPHFKRRMEWFFNYKPEYKQLISMWKRPGSGIRRRFSVLKGTRLIRVLSRMLNETEFLSDYGIRALSKYHKDHPYSFKTESETLKVSYQPAESDSGMFGGNSNWRGPIWFPVNYLLVESLYKFYNYYGDEFEIEHPTGSGKMLNLKQVADELSNRLINIFKEDAGKGRPVYAKREKLQKDPHFKNYVLFYEFFNGDTGEGIGASHQTGWTGLVADLIFKKYNNKYY
jgi:hypothetical protein